MLWSLPEERKTEVDMVTPSCALTPAPKTSHPSVCFRGSHSTVLSLPLKSGAFVHYWLHLPACCLPPPPAPGRTLESQRQRLKPKNHAEATAPRRAHGLFVISQPRSPVTDPACLSHHFLQLCLWSSWQGLCWGSGACRWRDGMASFSMGMNSFRPQAGLAVLWEQ